MAVVCPSRTCAYSNPSSFATACFVLVLAYSCSLNSASSLDICSGVKSSAGRLRFLSAGGACRGVRVWSYVVSTLEPTWGALRNGYST